MLVLNLATCVHRPSGRRRDRAYETGGGKKGGGHPRKKRESRITWAIIFAVIVLVILLVAICLFIKCRKAQQEARARGSTNWQAPPPSVELGKPEPAPGHWRPADEMQTQTPV